MSRRELLIYLALTSACTAAEVPVVDTPIPTPPTTTATMPSLDPTDINTLGGVVHELQSAGHYTYVRVGAPGTDGDWAVVLGALETSLGAAITLSVQGSQTDFHSRRLDRDFEQLFFASVPSRA